MRNLPPPLTQALIWRRRVMAFAVLLLLGGCGTTNGDFGEVQPYLVSDGIHDWVGPYATGSVASKFDLTDDERALRDLSYPLVEAPYERQRWYSVVAEYGLVKPDRRTVDRTSYSKCLMSSEFRSPSARYAQLDDDIRNDLTRMPQFFETAGRVLDIESLEFSCGPSLRGSSNPWRRPSAKRRNSWPRARSNLNPEQWRCSCVHITLSLLLRLS
jgi:hypothetical protein